MTEPPAALGRRVAQELMVSGASADVRPLADKLGVEIVTLDSPPPAQPGLRSEYQPSPPRIILYRTAIARVGAGARTPTCGSRVPPATPHQIEDLHIAHELFHHLQATHRLARLSVAEEEEAAHAFAREVVRSWADPQARPGEQSTA